MIHKMQPWLIHISKSQCWFSTLLSIKITLSQTKN